MRSSTLSQIRGRVGATERDRKRVLERVAEGDFDAAEDDVQRNMDFLVRTMRVAAVHSGFEGMRESMQGNTNDFRPAAFMNEGAFRHRCVGKIVIEDAYTLDNGTGFLISPNLLLTNQHVIQNSQQARRARVIFNYETDDRGVSRRPSEFELDPRRFEIYNDEADLDFALIAIGNRIKGNALLDDLGFCPISNTPNRHRKGMNANIVQHPGGNLKTIAFRNNIVSARTSKYLLYSTDTLRGSSGAPVFNDDWDVVALHHYGAPSQERDEDGNIIEKNVNEGIRISAIYERLEEEMTELDGPQKAMLGEALQLFDQATAQLPRIEVRTEPDSLPQEDTRAALEPEKGTDMEAKHQTSIESGAIRLTVPLEISIRLGSETNSDERPGIPQLTDRSSRRPQLSAAEGKRLDRDYSNRNGFKTNFITGLSVDLQAILEPIAHRIQPLKPNQADAEEGELKYQNFSVVMDSERGFALLSATNIDAESYKDIDRKTGDLREGENWYIERRIDRDAFVDQSFYSEWSHIFDRGHLTRRTDPTWGTEEEAKRANADTYHFTNCTPQQWRFNQTIEFWQGIERYILENGVSAAKKQNRITVLQGPIYAGLPSENPRHFAHEVAIPIEFWKLILWRKGNTKKAVALIASQEAMLDEIRSGGSFGEDDDVDVDVEEFRVSVEELELRTGMDFSAFRAMDTIKDEDAPNVGESARKMRLNSWSDIKLYCPARDPQCHRYNTRTKRLIRDSDHKIERVQENKAR